MRTLGFAGAFALLAIVDTFPLIGYLASALPGQGLGDNLSFVWNLWWMREALASPGLSFWSSPLLMAPVGASLVLHTHTALAAGIGATVLRALPLVVAQNVLLLASLTLNGLAAYALARAAGATLAGAAVGGALFELSPAITVRLMGHYNFVVAWPLLFACAAYVWWWTRGGMPRAVLAGAVAATIPYADYYHVVYFALFAAAYAAVQTFGRTAIEYSPRRGRSPIWFAAGAAVLFAMALAIAVAHRPAIVLAGVRISTTTPTNVLTAAWLLAAVALLTRVRIRIDQGVTLRRWPPTRQWVLLAAVGVVLVLPVAIPAVRMIASGGYVTQTAALRSSPRGVDVATLVLGPPFSGTVGGMVRGLYGALGLDVMESSAWIGLVPLALVAAGARRLWREEDGRRWLLVGLVFVMWALGPYLIVAGFNTGLILPQAIAHVIPGINNARIPGRAMVMVAAVASVLIAMAISRRALPRAWTSTTAMLAIVVVAAVDLLAAPMPLVALGEPGVYRDLSRDRSGGAVLTVPFGIRDGFGEDGHLEDESLYGQTIHRHPLLGGFLARIPPATRAWYASTEPYRTLLALSASRAIGTLPDCVTTLAGLRAASVGFVVAYPSHLTPRLRTFLEAMPLEQVAADGARVLYRVAPARCGVR